MPIIFIAVFLVSFLVGSGISYYTRPPNQQTPPLSQTPTVIPITNTPELSCNIDSDCGISLCSGCRIMNKNYIRPEDKICQINCNQTPVCYQGRCINKVGENQYQIEVENN